MLFIQTLLAARSISANIPCDPANIGKPVTRRNRARPLSHRVKSATGGAQISSTFI
jgi:hypothetical protein